MSTPSVPSESTRRRHEKGRRTRRPSGALVRFWQEWRAEIIIVGLGLLAIFLLVERMNIRQTLYAWFVRLITGLGNFGTSLVASLRRFVANTTLSDLTAYLLILIVLVLFAWRLRWRVMRLPGLTSQECPRCGGELHRIHRHGLDRLLSLYIPVRRYQCKEHGCHWQGLRVGKSRHE